MLMDHSWVGPTLAKQKAAAHRHPDQQASLELNKSESYSEGSSLPRRGIWG